MSRARREKERQALMSAKQICKTCNETPCVCEKEPCPECGERPCTCVKKVTIQLGREERREEKEDKKEDKKEERKEKTVTSRQWRIDKINALKEKFYAVALKRKWLVFLIGIGLIAYLVISSGGLSLGGIFDKIKGIF